MVGLADFVEAAVARFVAVRVLIVALPVRSFARGAPQQSTLVRVSFAAAVVTICLNRINREMIENSIIIKKEGFFFTFSLPQLMPFIL